MSIKGYIMKRISDREEADVQAMPFPNHYFDAILRHSNKSTVC
jgi:hypothetical protein